MDVGFRCRCVAAGRTILAVALCLGNQQGLAQQVGLPPVNLPVEDLPAEQVRHYRDALGKLLPVPPNVIDDFQGRLLRNRAAAANDRPEPEAVLSEAELVTLEPGGRPPLVRLSPGIATVINFSDATGRPWPVAGYVIGDREAFDVLHPGGVDGQQGPSHLTAAPLRYAGWTNLVVSLAGESTPVVMTLIVDMVRPHYRLDVQVLELGPNADPTPVSARTPPKAGSRQLLQFVAAVDLPEAARETKINIGGTRVWVSPPEDGGRTMWVRTSHALLGPEWMEVLSAPNDLRVYRLPAASMLLFSVDGRAVLARVDLP